jgi:hypothetical protein
MGASASRTKTLSLKSQTAAAIPLDCSFPSEQTEPNHFSAAVEKEPANTVAVAIATIVQTTKNIVFFIVFFNYYFIEASEKIAWIEIELNKDD